jgi:hypothetical protein
MSGQETFKMKIPMRSAAVGLILAAAVAGCGGTVATSSLGAQDQPSALAQASASAPAESSAPAASNANAASGAAIDACALISEQEATAFLGSDPGPGVETGSASSPACAYGASLTIGVELNDGKALFDTTKAAMQGSGKAQTLSGVGDAGFVFIVANTIAQMAILKGSTLLQINIQGDPSLQNITLAALTALGTTAVGRL